MRASADEAEQSHAEQSWPGLFWLPPADEEAGERDMLHLDDELAGLVESDMPAETHTAKPEPASSVPGGRAEVTHWFVCWCIVSDLLCTGALCCAVPHGPIILLWFASDDMHLQCCHP